METKICTKCKQEKLLTEFYWTNKEWKKRMSHCKECRKEYDHAHYLKNKKRSIERAHAQKRRGKKFLSDYKKENPCIRCGEANAICLVFHHRDSGKKEEFLSIAANRGWSTKRLESEIEKCDVLCANCHRKVHYKMRNT